MFPDVRVSVEEIETALREDVLKREVFEGESAAAARKKVSRAANRVLRKEQTDGTDAGEAKAEAASSE